MAADLETLRTRWTNLFDEVIQHGRSMGQKEALTNLMATVQAQLHPNPEVSSAVEPIPTVTPSEIDEPAKRARPGYVQEQVGLILRGSELPLTPLRIVEVARSEGIELKESSVRMALLGLQAKHRAISLGTGEWSILIRSPIAEAAHAADFEHGDAEHYDARAEAIADFME